MLSLYNCFKEHIPLTTMGLCCVFEHTEKCVFPSSVWGDLLHLVLCECVFVCMCVCIGREGDIN